MIFKDLLDLCDVDEVCEVWKKKYNCDFDPVSSVFIPDYIEYLKTLTPTKANKYKIFITKDSDDQYIILGKDINNKSYMLDFSTNEQWLGFEMDSNLKISDELKISTVIVYVLWEMTFHGLYNEDRQEIVDEINERSKEIDKWNNR